MSHKQVAKGGGGRQPQTSHRVVASSSSKSHNSVREDRAWVKEYSSYKQDYPASGSMGQSSGPYEGRANISGSVSENVVRGASATSRSSSRGSKAEFTYNETRTVRVEASAPPGTSRYAVEQAASSMAQAQNGGYGQVSTYYGNNYSNNYNNYYDDYY